MIESERGEATGLPLTEAQQAIWYAQALDTDNTGLLVAEVVRIGGRCARTSSPRRCAGPSSRLRLAEQRCWWWFVRAHHIALDTYGMALVQRRVAEHYTALDTGRPAASNPFPPLARLLEMPVDQARHDADLQYWLSRFADRPAPPRRQTPGGESGGSTHRAAHRAGVALPAGFVDGLAAVVSRRLRH